MKNNLFLLSIICLLVACNTNNDNKKSNTDSEKTIVDTTKMLRIGETLKSDMFEITLNSAKLTDYIEDKKQFINEKSKENEMFLILNVSYKNVDSESRMVVPGSVFIKYNEKEYEYDQTESILGDGWDVTLEQINPLTSYRSNIVYKLPKELRGNLTWKPGRINDNQFFFIGNLQN